MPFVERDTKGLIVAVHNQPRDGVTEELPKGHPEIVAFLGTADEAHGLRAGLADSDLDVVRVIEDLIEALLRRGFIEPADLPSPALKKITQRREMRSRLRGLLGLAGEKGDRPR